MVQYLHFRILKFPLNFWGSPFLPQESHPNCTPDYLWALGDFSEALSVIAAQERRSLGMCFGYMTLEFLWFMVVV